MSIQSAQATNCPPWCDENQHDPKLTGPADEHGCDVGVLYLPEAHPIHGGVPRPAQQRLDVMLAQPMGEGSEPLVRITQQGPLVGDNDFAAECLPS